MPVADLLDAEPFISLSCLLLTTTLENGYYCLHFTGEGAKKCDNLPTDQVCTL